MVDQGQLAKARAGLPSAGQVSELVADLLASMPGEAALGPATAAACVGPLIDAVEEPIGDDDLQLALYLCYEQHYRSFPSIHPALEWDPTLLTVQALLETAFFGSLDAEIPAVGVAPEAVGAAISRLHAADSGSRLWRRLELTPSLDELRELAAHLSLHHLKGADPHSWAIPRLGGAAKRRLLEVQASRYGCGQSEQMHSQLFTRTMRALGLDERENAYLDHAPGPTLATVNLMSGLGLHRSRRGALVGHLAMFQIAAAQPTRRYGDILRRLGFDDEAAGFYDEHADAGFRHESAAVYDLAGGLALQEPNLAEDIVFGARALLFLEERFAAHLLDAWQRGESSLRRPL
jgi:hypothetical protein